MRWICDVHICTKLSIIALTLHAFKYCWMLNWWVLCVGGGWQHNDNSGNAYSDVFWLASVIESVSCLEFGQQVCCLCIFTMYVFTFSKYSLFCLCCFSLLLLPSIAGSQSLYWLVATIFHRISRHCCGYWSRLTAFCSMIGRVILCMVLFRTLVFVCSVVCMIQRKCN